MKYSSSVKRNYFFSALYQILLIIMPLITTPYVSRVFGSTGVGAYTMVNTIASYFVLLAMMGVATYGNRNIAYVRDDSIKINKTFSEIYYAQLFFCIVALTIYLIYAFHSSGHIDLVFIHFLYVLSAFFDVSWFFYGIEKIDIIAKINFVIKVVTVALIFVFVKRYGDLWIYAIIMCSSFLLNSMATWVLAFRHVKLVKVSIESIKKNFKPIVILFLPVIAATVYKTMDKIMLGVITGSDKLVGLYNNSEQMIGFPQGIITSVGIVMLPRAANMLSNGEYKKNLSELRISMRFVNFLSCGVTFGVASIAKEFVPIFLGNDFLKCIEYIILLAPCNLFISWGYTVRNQYLIPNQRDKIYILSIVGGAVINFILNTILIRKINIVGAIIGTLVAEAVVAIWQTYAVKDEIKASDYIKDAVPFFLSAIIMSYFVRLIGNNLGVHIYTVILEIISGAMIYILIIAIYMWLFERENLQKIKNMLKKTICHGTGRK